MMLHIRALTYSHNDDWLVSADHDGIIKYWQTNFNNVKVIQGHNDAIRDIAFSPNDSKFVTASDDSTLKIFDFAGGAEESVLTGPRMGMQECRLASDKRPSSFRIKRSSS
jgi:polyadenylation factor subunit 2